MHRGDTVQSVEIADAERIPKKFLDAIMLEIKNMGLVTSKKGKGGGYQLFQSPDTISLGQVIRVLDGPLAPVSCVSRTAYARCADCRDERACLIRPVMQRVRDAISGILDNTTLEDMIADTKFMDSVVNYDI